MAETPGKENPGAEKVTQPVSPPGDKQPKARPVGRELSQPHQQNQPEVALVMSPLWWWLIDITSVYQCLLETPAANPEARISW